MREILFKAKNLDTKEWEEGSVIVFPDGDTFIYCAKSENILWEHKVDPCTVCQYTGLKDKNGMMIFENDIVTIENTKKLGLPGVIVYNRLSAAFELARNGYNSIRLDYFEDGKSEFVVVGNIFDKENKK